jgi:outer membrane protein assembly factor BamB
MSLLDGNVLLAFGNEILLLNPVDGSPVNLYDTNGTLRVDEQGNPRRWIVRPEGNAQVRFYNTPVPLNDETLLAVSYDRKVFEIDLLAARINNPTGFDIPGHVTANVLQNDDLLYVPLSEHNLVALSMQDYLSVWTFETERGIWAQPLLSDGTLYITSMDHNVYALDAMTGEEIWQLDVGGAIASTPVLHNGFLYVGSFARKLYQISLDGEIVAEHPTNEWVWGSPVIVDETLYAADLGGWVYALELNGDGFSELWQQQVATRAIRPSPIVTEDRIVVGARDHFVYWISRETGETLVRHDVRAEILSDLLLLEPSETVQISQSLLLVNTMSRENLLFAFPADGNAEPVWKYPR